jgi:2-polyprenyl-3-methyl-5-hydroxy-6-metoxy-1,4-benzoquinol methylase
MAGLNSSKPAVLATTEGFVEVVPISTDRFRVTLKPHDSNTFIPRRSCETSLPPDVISSFLDASFTRLCDSLARHDDPEYVIKVLGNQLFAYFDAAEFRGKRLLDFGCGTGASTLYMGALFPETEVVGVELNPDKIELARRVLRARPLSNVRFLQSPDPKNLPAGIGSFDFVMLSAVYEHLLPAERSEVMPLIWSKVKPGGTLFINQTPYRYFPFEHHTTGLWLVNYLPDWLSLFLARRLSKMNPDVNKSRDWNVHLRAGIRGGTEAEVLSNLSRAAGRATVMQPRNLDRAAYWLSGTNPQRHQWLKRAIAWLFRLTDKLWGTVPSMNLDVAIRKGRA